MSKEKRRVPKLRFPGFTEDWEQRKADYIFKSVTEKGYPELPVLSASQELGMVYRDQNGIDIQHDKKNESSYKRVSPGQFVIHLRSFQGGFAYSEVEGITSPAYTVMSFKNSSEQYGLFWKYVFKSETFIKRLETITYGIRDGRSISFSDFKSLMLQYPSFSEQELIGDLIAIIESGITLHQRKLNNLKLKKKALLQKLFPKNGERYPELRFPGFTDAWEQRKLTSFTQRVKGNDGRMDLPTLTISASEGWLNQKDRFSANIAGSEQKNYTLLRQGELSYNHGNSKLAKYGVVYALKDYKEALVPRVYHSFRVDESYDALFVEYYFSTKRPDRELGKLVSSGARMDGLLNIGYDEFTNISISVPTFSEQKQIVALLKVCDKYITLHQRKLDHLQLQKKALLQQMFV